MLTATRTKEAFLVVPSSQNAAELLVHHRHTLVGVRQFNSRLSEDYLRRLSGWALGEFDEVGLYTRGPVALPVHFTPMPPPMKPGL